ncbi:MAG: 50S ribosomal protein L1 [Candidatus Komeilibacteria bacterium CG10_big_fil_rev_8_21_14_0_10_41_13]|uniref:Large ribosomal subunit protein uL1 n=1 Tax=Candidatus Komeilibacteria bacterium CG10_big_fil_rev_8_21_14_0_10_41_13 TaxID=1974476 RepID=A0A2M6WDG8_9BACT|nr:MAG: 50S ribosomal protein L1 [Candidatus Komeilibacteria bacterium CG10_big_fil_rev_8_21_14_0_10_41_13]
MKHSKRFTELKSKVDKDKLYPLSEAVKLVRETSGLKFDASVEVHVKLGIDPKKGDQIVRSSVVLPHGTGKTKKIAAFVTPGKEKEAREAGADLVGGKELIEQIKKDGKCDFEVAVAVPEIMKDLAVIAKTLGQKGLMPNPKVGTVTPNVKQAIEEIKKGKADFKNDDSGNLHIMVGKVSFEENKLTENIEAFLEAVKKAKPDSIKGTYLRGVTIASSMGPGIRVQL